jgi:hypothetical protein
MVGDLPGEALDILTPKIFKAVFLPVVLEPFVLA